MVAWELVVKDSAPADGTKPPRNAPIAFAASDDDDDDVGGDGDRIWRWW